ncbi:PREDICTED: snRNA-activating protein complex subunit 3 [Gekko japonicus]|uniref:snRNA-activating protein complex subunit 3 n=1 Tax=Gekko japonicus TaxID=146911 RepID=A0ABM1L4K6_GEKJA|nr:PREDICTED: snRNA-activating protein complex subunit 3 [Gekko japonicus]
MAASSSRDHGAGGCRSNIPQYEDATSERNTQVFHVASFGAAWRGALHPQDLSLHQAASEDQDAAVAEEFSCPPEFVSELKAVCSIDALKSPGKEDTEEIPEDTSLLTLTIRKKALERREETVIVDRACRQETFLYEMESHAIGKRPNDPVNLVKEGELVLTLNIFYPVIFQKHKTHKPYQTMLVLGSQYLTEVRDSISCVSDLQIGGEFSSHPDQAPEYISKDLYKSAFFYFEGIFYNDMRYPECRNLSRLIHRDDCLDRSLYPLLIKKHWLWTKKCFVCKTYTARWVTNDDSLAPQDPSFFCDVCFQMLHYDADGNKLGEFLAYPYVDPGIFN